MGILITMADPPRGVIDAANHGGTYTWPVLQRAHRQPDGKVRGVLVIGDLGIRKTGVEQDRITVGALEIFVHRGRHCGYACFP